MELLEICDSTTLHSRMWSRFLCKLVPKNSSATLAQLKKEDVKYVIFVHSWFSIYCSCIVNSLDRRSLIDNDCGDYNS